MIHYIPNKEVDIARYDQCISKALNTRIYAYSWYLNQVTDQWDLMVLDDYKAVMPLPRRKKYGLNYIYLPPWTQQLGVFSNQEVSPALSRDFLKAIPKKFKFIDILFNAENKLEISGVKQRQNFVLALNSSYESLYKAFSKGRKSSIKQGRGHNLIIFDNCTPQEIIAIFKKNRGANLQEGKEAYTCLRKLITQALPKEFAMSLGILNAENRLIGGAFFLKDTHRITYLFSAINEEGREKHAMSFLLDHIIEKHAGSELILDFEGSVIKSLASFFKSFGAQSEQYLHLKKWRL